MAEDLGYVHEDAFDEGFLKVDSIHNLYYAQYGARDGKPGKQFVHFLTTLLVSNGRVNR